MERVILEFILLKVVKKELKDLLKKEKREFGRKKLNMMFVRILLIVDSELR